MNRIRSRIIPDSLPVNTKALARRTRKSTQNQILRTGAMGGQTESQVRSQVHASRQKVAFHAYTVALRSRLCRLKLGAQTMKNLRRVAYEFEPSNVNVSHRKSTQVGGETKSKTFVDLRRLARA